MMRYTKPPKAARPVYVVEGERDTDGRTVGVYVEQYNDTLYAEWSISHEVVYRHQATGKNRAVLIAQLTEIRTGLSSPREAGPWSIKGRMPTL